MFNVSDVSAHIVQHCHVTRSVDLKVLVYQSLSALTGVCVCVCPWLCDSIYIFLRVISVAGLKEVDTVITVREK